MLAVLDTAVAEIATLERYLAALKKQKRGLMQKLLTGEWRVNPSKRKPARDNSAHRSATF
ncbi:MAG: hypothetical protein IPK39_05160 [Sulfuritalea sp.]|nr:hypothetical protein [Sulfuritalea sp.]